MLPIVRTGLDTDMSGILTLQAQNLYTHLAQTELSDGFVMTPLTPATLTTLIDRQGIFVAEARGQVVGYLCAADWDFFAQWEIFRVMMERLPELELAGRALSVDRSFQYGPICIDRTYRGSDVLPNLFTLMRLHFADRFPVGVTFINKLNQRSFAAHTRKLNLQVVDEFGWNEHLFYTLAFATSSSSSSI